MFLMLMQAKSNFFDRAQVKNSMDSATRRALSKSGAFVRQRAKTSIRKRAGSSKPGQAPHSHVGLLRKYILFAYEPARQSVVIGPAKLRADSQAPRLLEHGGTITRQDGKKRRTLHYRPRPLMRPALEQEQRSLPALWHNSLR